MTPFNHVLKNAVALVIFLSVSALITQVAYAQPAFIPTGNTPLGSVGTPPVSNFLNTTPIKPTFVDIQPPESVRAMAVQWEERGLKAVEPEKASLKFNRQSNVNPLVLAESFPSNYANEASASQAPLTSFPTLNTQSNIDLAGGRVIPPDNHGTVGMNEVIAVQNISWAAYDKSGTMIFEQSLADFFGTTSAFPFDARIHYDWFTDRFVFIAISLDDLGTNTNELYVATSPVGTVSGTWNIAVFDGELVLGVGESFCDYPTLGVDEEAIYIGCNYFAYTGAFGGSRLQIIDKGDIIAGTAGAGSINVYDPGAASGFDFCTFTWQPSHAQTDPDPGGNTGLFISSFSGCTDGTSYFQEVIRIDDPLGTPVFTAWFPEMGPVCPTGTGVFCPVPAAEQLGSAQTIDSGGNRTFNSVFRDGLIYTTTTVQDPVNTGDAAAAWTQIDQATLNAAAPGTSPPFSVVSVIGGEEISSDMNTFFPSITANDDCVAIGYSGSSSSEFAGMFYSKYDLTLGIQGITVTGVEGTDWYFEDFGSGRNRWGDYTSTVLDPADDSIWYFNQSAIDKGAFGGQWQMHAIQETCANIPLPVELHEFGARSNGTDVTLSWTTLSEDNNLGFYIEQLTDGEFEEVAFVEGAGESISPKSYSYQIDGLESGVHAFRLRQVDFDGAATFSDQIEVLVGVPNGYMVTSAYPNPFNPSTGFDFMVERGQDVNVRLFNVAGQEVKNLFSGFVDSNSRTNVSVNAADLPSGMYFYVVEGQSFVSKAHVITLMK